MTWQTPNAPGALRRCRVLRFPDSDDYERIVRGAIRELSLAYNWSKVGDQTVDEVVQQFTQTIVDFCEVEMCVPIGAVIAIASDVVPEGYLLCDGSTAQIANYPGLYAVVGDTWGSAPAGEFRLPDYRGKTLIGAGPLDGHDTQVVGDTGGAGTVQLTESQMPAHTHTTVPHGHGYTPAVASPLTVGLEPPAPSAVPGVATTQLTEVSVNSAGGGGFHENVPPFAAVYYCVRSG